MDFDGHAALPAGAGQGVGARRPAVLAGRPEALDARARQVGRHAPPIRKQLTTAYPSVLHLCCRRACCLIVCLLFCGSDSTSTSCRHRAPEDTCLSIEISYPPGGADCSMRHRCAR